MSFGSRPFPWGTLAQALLFLLVGVPFTTVGARDFDAGVMPGGPIMFAVGLLLIVIAIAVLVLIAADSFAGRRGSRTNRAANGAGAPAHSAGTPTASAELPAHDASTLAPDDREQRNLGVLRGLTGDPRPIPQWATVTLLIVVVLVGFLYVPKGQASLFIFMLVLSYALGYFTTRRPIGNRQFATIWGVVLLVILIVLFGARWETIQPGFGYLALTVLPMTGLGRCAGGLANRWFGVPVRVLRRAWREVDFVEASDYPDPVRFDVRPLRDRVSRAQQRGYLRERVDQVPRVPWTRIVAGDVGVVAIGVGIFALGYGLSTELAGNEANRLSQALGMSVMLSLMVAIFAFFLWFRRRIRAQSSSVADHIRYERFAELNDLIYEAVPAPHPQLTLTRSMTGELPSGRPVLYGNYELAEGALPASYFGGIVSIQLDTQLPSMMLRSKRGFRLLFASPLVPNRDQRLSLEGDFDRYFDLYSPKGYERDALYLFTPDVLVRLMDGVDSFDVSISGSELTLTARHEIVTLDPWVWSRVAVAINALNDRIAAWERWREDRPISEEDLAAGQLIATPGRRLRAGLSLGFALILLYAASFAGVVLFANAL